MNDMSNFNLVVFRAIYGLSHRNIFLDDIGIFLANYLPYILVLGFLVLLYYQRGWRLRLYWFAEAAIAILVSRGLITEIIRHFYNHPRPFDALGIPALIFESGNSFPSGHMTFFFPLALAVLYMNRTWGWWYIALTAIMGVARIYVGVHWPFDIAGGALIGIACALAVHAALRPQRNGLLKNGGTA